MENNGVAPVKLRQCARSRAELQTPRHLNGDRSTHAKTSPSPYSGRTVVRGVSLEIASGEVVGLLGPNGAGKTTTFSMVVGLAVARLRPGAARRHRRHRRSDVRPGPAGHRLPAAGGVDLPRPDGRAEHRSPSSRRSTSTRAARGPPHARAAGRARPDAARQVAGLHAVGRRAAAGRDHPGAGHVAEVHAARRAVRGHRSDRRDRHPEDHLPPQGARHRRADHRPQRAGNAADHRPRLHRPRRRDLPQRHARKAWPRTRR